MVREYETARVEDRGEGLLLLTLNRPEAANAMNTQMGRDLLAFFDAVNAAPAQTRSIVMTGAGERAFCAGGDLKERNGMTDEAWQDQHLLFERMIRAFIGCPVPVIGAVNGAAYAGGCELALCCDFIYAAETARFALTEVTLGIMPGAGGTQNLPRAVGERRAKEIILTGRPFTAAEACEWGMVNRVCAPGTVVDEALETARRIADNAPISVRQAKHAIHFGMQTGPRQRHDARNRGLQPHGPDRGPPRRHRLLQRKAQTAVQGPLTAGGPTQLAMHLAGSMPRCRRPRQSRPPRPRCIAPPPGPGLGSARVPGRRPHPRSDGRLRAALADRPEHGKLSGGRSPPRPRSSPRKRQSKRLRAFRAGPSPARAGPTPPVSPDLSGRDQVSPTPSTQSRSRSQVSTERQYNASMAIT